MENVAVHFLNGLFYKVFREDKPHQTILVVVKKVTCFIFFFQRLKFGVPYRNVVLYSLTLMPSLFTRCKTNFFFLIATWLLNSSKWQPIQKKLVMIFKDKQNLLSVFQIDPPKLSQGKDLSCAAKWTLGWNDIQHSSSLKSKMVSSYWKT